MSLFANAKETKTVKTPSSKKEKVERTVIGLEKMAALDSLIKNLEAIKATLDAEIKTEAKTYFVATGETLKRRPENFRAVEGESSASIELKKRSTRSPLSEEEMKMLDSAGIKYEKQVTVQECFVVNPKYSVDMEFLEKVSQRLEGHVPDDFFQRQNEKSTHVVSDQTVDQVFASDSLAVMFDVVTTMAVKPSDGNDMKFAMDLLKQILN